MPEPDAEVAQDGRVGQVALGARDGQLGAEVREDGVGESEVPLRILIVDRVHLVRHRRRADLARHDALLEVAEGDVPPHVAREVDQDGVEASYRVEERRDEVVRLDLRRVRVVHQPEGLDKPLGEGGPVGGRRSREVGLVRAGGSGDLAENLLPLERGDLWPEPRDDVGHLLADGGRGGGLSVRVREHRHVGERVRHLDQLVDYLAHRGQQHLRARVAQHQRVRQVVDVLGSARKVDELSGLRQLRRQRLGSGNLLLEVVLDSLDVVVGRPLDGLDPLRLGHVKVVRDRLQQRDARGIKRRQLRKDALLGEAEEPGDLDLHAVLDQPELREVLAQ
mmetsp:Transcript_21877/g.72489  ORF Transcript_21877/g.72489 Transcript_21877/m.72489 type:complete len:335 (-) Transcript_21877:125-1129(-)